MFTSTDSRRRRIRFSVAAAMVWCCLAASVAAHDLPKKDGTREVVRLQGYRAELPPGMQAQREVVLSILGEEHKFYLTDWRRFRLVDDEPAQEEDRARFDLQAKRSLLLRVANAKPGQQVTILAERRAASADLFVLALDLCPPD